MRRSPGSRTRGRFRRFLRLQAELRRRSMRVLRSRLLRSTGNDRYAYATLQLVHDKKTQQRARYFFELITLILNYRYRK